MSGGDGGHCKSAQKIFPIISFRREFSLIKFKLYKLKQTKVPLRKKKKRKKTLKVGTECNYVKHKH